MKKMGIQGRKGPPRA